MIRHISGAGAAVIARAEKAQRSVHPASDPSLTQVWDGPGFLRVSPRSLALRHRSGSRTEPETTTWAGPLGLTGMGKGENNRGLRGWAWARVFGNRDHT